MSTAAAWSPAALLSALGVGALAGGLAYGAREWPGGRRAGCGCWSRLPALGYLPLVLVPGVAGCLP